MISAVIVNYRSPGLLRRCLASLGDFGEVIVVDNASGDESVEMVRRDFPFAEIVVSNENRGFGAGANIGMAQTSGDFALILNPDTWVSHETKPSLERFIDSHPDAGIIGCGLYDPDGLPLVSARRFYTPAITALRRLAPVSPLIRRFELLDHDLDRPTRVDWVAGSGMAVRTETFRNIGGFDDRFFLYFEDVDLCLRMWLEGSEVWHVRSAPVFHVEGRASSRAARPLLWHLGSWAKFEAKWSGTKVRGFTDPAHRNGGRSASPASGLSPMRPPSERVAPGALRVAIESSMLLDSLTGVGRSLEALVKAFAERDDIDPLLIGFSLRRTGRVHRYRALARTRAVRVPARGAQAVWNRLEWPPIESFSERIDVVHGPNFFVPPARGAGSVVTIHDLGFVRFPQYHSANQKALSRILPQSLKRTDRVITVSEFTRDELCEWSGFDPSRIDVVPHGVRRLPADGPRPEGLPREFLLYAGTLEARKGAALLMESYRIATLEDPSVPPLVLAGTSGFGGDEAVAEAEAKGLDARRVIRLGRVDDSALGRLYADATAFLFPSLYEGFGMPPLEAMAEATPVLATATSSLPEVLGDAALLVEADPEDVADGIRRISGENDLRSRLCAAGLDRASQFTWERSAELTISSYRSAIAEASHK